MASSAYGRKLNPHRRAREPQGVKAERQSIVVTNNPSSIDQNQSLLVRFPSLGTDDVIVPGTARLAFTTSLTSSDKNRTVVQNLGRAMVKKTSIRFNGNEVLSLDDSDVFGCYGDIWMTSKEREKRIYQGLDTSVGRNVNKLRVGAEDGDDSAVGDKAVADAYGNRFYIPLDFELLESHMPFYQSALGDRLEYELTFNDYSRVINASGDPEASYKINNIALEFDKVSDPNLARTISSQYSSRTSILYERVLRQRMVRVNKSDAVWNVNLNTPARSMKGILLLFEEPHDPYKRNTEAFYNPKITKVETTIEGVPNQLYSQGMGAYQQWDEARKYFAGGLALARRHPEAAVIAKALELSDVTLSEYLTTKYALWLDLRTSDDDLLHGSGRRVENASEGITLQITKQVQLPGKLNMYIYLVMDAQVIFENGRYASAIY